MEKTSTITLLSLHLGLLVVSLATLPSCGKERLYPGSPEHSQVPSTPARTTPRSSEDARGLVNSDLDSLSRLDASRIARYDALNHGRFSQIFGGHTGSHVRAFLSERVRHFLFRSSINRIEPSALDRDPLGPTTVAANLGASLWIEGLLNHTPVTVYLNSGVSIPITSSRDGLIQFPIPYGRFRTRDGRTGTYPLEYRLSVLTHEGRHSDCTGGLTTQQVEAARRQNRAGNPNWESELGKCVHAHTTCTRGPLEGESDCDGHPWGALSIQIVYLEANLHEARLAPNVRRILEDVVIDLKSRLLFSYSDLISGTLGEPDLSSAGLR